MDQDPFFAPRVQLRALSHPCAVLAVRTAGREGVSLRGRGGCGVAEGHSLCAASNLARHDEVVGRLLSRSEFAFGRLRTKGGQEEEKALADRGRGRASEDDAPVVLAESLTGPSFRQYASTCTSRSLDHSNDRKHWRTAARVKNVPVFETKR